jgi:hypothetical protein
MRDFRKEGYTVDLVHLEATPEISRRRNIQRFYDTGRLVEPEHLAAVRSKPHEVYHLLKGGADDRLDVETVSTPA